MPNEKNCQSFWIILQDIERSQFHAETKALFLYNYQKIPISTEQFLPFIKSEILDKYCIFRTFFKKKPFILKTVQIVLKQS